MNELDELQRVTTGRTGAGTPGGVGLVDVLVRCRDEDVSVVLDRAREVLAAVLRVPTHNWPDADADWSGLLPAWFVRACAPQRTPEELAAWQDQWARMSPGERAEAVRARPWTLGEWIAWFEPDEREWFWWDATPTSATSATVRVQIDGWPAPFGSLVWLLTAAGASEVTIPDA